MFAFEDVTRVRVLSSTQEKSLPLSKTWLRQNITKEPEIIHNSYVAKVKENVEIETLRRGTMKISADVKESENSN